MANGSNGYRRPRIGAAMVIVGVIVVQALSSIIFDRYNVAEGTLLIELTAVLALLGLEAWDVLRRG